MRYLVKYLQDMAEDSVWIDGFEAAIFYKFDEDYNPYEPEHEVIPYRHWRQGNIAGYQFNRSQIEIGKELARIQKELDGTDQT